MHARPLALTLILTLPACGGKADTPKEQPAAGQGEKAEGEPSDAKPATGAAAASGAEAGTGAEAATGAPTAKPDFTKPPKAADTAKAKADADAFREALAAGRKAVQARDLKTGQAKFREALALDPNHAGVLGELGWAAFLANDFATARAATHQALIYADNPKRRGALLYNLGRISESEGNKGAAMGHYKHSLALRDNETVKKRLAKLETEGQAVPAGEDAPAGPEALCKESEADSTCALEKSECKCEVVKQGKAAAADATLVEAAITRVFGHAEGLGEVDEAELWVRTATGSWQSLGFIADANVPGVSYIANEYDITRFEFTQFFAGGPEELIVELTQRRTDGDYAENLIEYEDTKLRWLCTSEGSATECLRIPLSDDWGTDMMLDDGPKPTADELGSAKWAWTVGAKAGKLVFRVDEGEDQLGDLKSLVGEKTPKQVGAHDLIEVAPLL